MKDSITDDLIMYEESKEIKESVWQIWDLLNDKDIITKILLNSSLVNEIEKIKTHTLLNLKDNKIENNKEKELSLEKQSGKNGNY
jgi:hypothetical protein